MKKLLLVLAAAAAPAWACIDPEQEFEDCALYVRRRDGREDSGMSTHAGAFRCHRIRPRDAVPDGACMCAGATDVKAVGHKTLHLTRRTKTSLDDAKLLGRNPSPAEPTAGLS